MTHSSDCTWLTILLLSYWFILCNTGVWYLHTWMCIIEYLNPWNSVFFEKLQGKNILFMNMLSFTFVDSWKVSFNNNRENIMTLIKLHKSVQVRYFFHLGGGVTLSALLILIYNNIQHTKKKFRFLDFLINLLNIHVIILFQNFYLLSTVNDRQILF